MNLVATEEKLGNAITTIDGGRSMTIKHSLA